jgi:hypothetical protein
LWKTGSQELKSRFFANAEIVELALVNRVEDLTFPAHHQPGFTADMRHKQRRRTPLEILPGERTRPVEASPSAQVEPQHHFFCARCGRVEEVYPDLPATVKQSMLSSIERNVRDVRLQFVGLCADCARRAEAVGGDQ